MALTCLAHISLFKIHAEIIFAATFLPILGITDASILISKRGFPQEE